MSKNIRWGILGTGNIAKQFARGVAAGKRGQVVAVGSRSEATAKAYAEEFKVPQSYGSYGELIEDSNVDAIYVSLPNSMHYEWTLEAIAAGKHVLCEKPIASNAVQAEEMFDAAQRKGVKLVEAFMYRSHPVYKEIQAKIREGAIGQLKMIRSSFCYRTTKVAGNIRFDANLFGGALMDIGCYCINLSRFIAGQEPKTVNVVANLHFGGVDEAACGVMQFPSGVMASFTCGMNLQADNTAYISGSDGYIEIPVPWKPPTEGATYVLARSTPPRMDSKDAKNASTPPRQTFTVGGGTDLYGQEADDFAAAVLDGTPVVITRADTLGNMRVLDELRQQIGVPTTDESRVQEQA